MPARRHADDEEAIRGLVVAYAERMDAGDFDGVADLFADGVFRSSRGTELVGRDAVRRQYDPVLLYEGGSPRTMHVLGNIEVELDAGGETATAHCTFMVLRPRRPVRWVLSSPGGTTTGSNVSMVRGGSPSAPCTRT